jgi:D-sorbitol dehydrogenase (acceptor)
MSKAAVISLTRSAALALAPHRIRVNAVCPGVVDTDLYRRVRAELDLAMATGEESRAASVPPAPLGDVGSPEDVAAMMVYLAGASGRYITGQAINVDGGRVMHG